MEQQVNEMLQLILAGQWKDLGQSILEQMLPILALGDLRQLFAELVFIGVMSALMTHFADLLEGAAVKSIGFMSIYFVMIKVLLECFLVLSDLTREVFQSYVLFQRICIPAYFTVLAATETLTVGAYYEIFMIVMYLLERVLLGIVFPAIQSYFLLILLNGAWRDDKLRYLTELLKKCIGYSLKGALWIVMAMSLFQAIVTPMVDKGKTLLGKKAIGAIPLLGDSAEGILELLLGAADIMKNGCGIVMLLLLGLMCLGPFLQAAAITLIMKLGAAFMGIVGDKRLTAVVNEAGETGLLLLQMVGYGGVFFFVSIAAISITR